MTIRKYNRPKPLTNDFDRFFNDFFFTPVRTSEKNRTFENLPAVNILEAEDSFQIELAAPGKNKEDFNIEIHDGVMTISSEEKTESTSEQENYSRREFNFSSFERRFTLPETAQDENIKASYDNGILKIEIPKEDVSAKNNKRSIEIS
jgi:HSP20 family protein